jgi:hypothetical protein
MPKAAAQSRSIRAQLDRCASRASGEHLSIVQREAWRNRCGKNPQPGALDRGRPRRPGKSPARPSMG